MSKEGQEYSFLSLKGGTMEGDIAMDSHKITGLPEPTSDSEAATKKYADEHGGGAGGMEVHDNEYHDPAFEQEGVAASLLATHQTTGIHTQPQVPQKHGNEAHDPDFATESALTAAKPKIILDVDMNNGGTNQQLPSTSNIIVMLDNEVTDLENAFDSSVKAGTATAASAGHLIDTTLNPFVAGDVGRKVWNTTDDTYTYITAYNSPSDVSVNDNIFTVGEGYKAYFAKFTAPSAMEVIVFAKCDVRNLALGKALQFQILKNGSSVSSELRYFSGGSQLGIINMSTPIILAANDYLQLEVAQDTGSKQYITSAGGVANWMRIVKLRDL